MLDAIHIFLAVADQGSLSKVARERALAVSSISRKIDTLEAELGFKLFQRSSRLLMLTDAGQHFLPRARNIVAELDEAKEAISALHADPRGLLTVTAPAAFGRRHVMPAVTSFLKRYPAIEITLHLSDQIVDLSMQRVDVAIRIGNLPDSDLVATTLAPARRLACASPDYLSRCGTPFSPAQLSMHNCLTVAAAQAPLGWWCFQGVNRNRPLPVHGNLKSDDTEALLQAATAGIGIVHLASWMVYDLIASGQLISLFPDALFSPQKNQPAIHSVRMPGRSHAAKAKLFIEHLKSEFGEPAYWDGGAGQKV